MKLGRVVKAIVSRIVLLLSATVTGQRQVRGTARAEWEVDDEEALRFHGLPRDMELEDFLAPEDRERLGYEPRDVIDYALTDGAPRDSIARRLTPRTREWVLSLEVWELVRISKATPEQVADHLAGRATLGLVRAPPWLPGMPATATFSPKKRKAAMEAPVPAVLKVPEKHPEAAPKAPSPARMAAARARRLVEEHRQPEPGRSLAYAPSLRLQMTWRGGR